MSHLRCVQVLSPWCSPGLETPSRCSVPLLLEAQVLLSFFFSGMSAAFSSATQLDRMFSACLSRTLLNVTLFLFLISLLLSTLLFFSLAQTVNLLQAIEGTRSRSCSMRARILRTFILLGFCNFSGAPSERFFCTVPYMFTDDTLAPVRAAAPTNPSRGCSMNCRRFSKGSRSSPSRSTFPCLLQFRT